MVHNGSHGWWHAWQTSRLRRQRLAVRILVIGNSSETKIDRVTEVIWSGTYLLTYTRYYLDEWISTITEVSSLYLLLLAYSMTRKYVSICTIFS